MKKIIVLIIFAIIIGFIVAKQTDRPKDSETIKIGVVAPLTGGAAVFGSSFVKGVEMALADLGNTQYTYELIIEDDSSTAAKSATAANKLIAIDNVSAIVSVTSGTGSAVAPIADSHNIVHICVACADKSIAIGENNYISSVLPEDEAKRWVEEAQSNRAQTIGLLTMNHPGVNAIADEVKKQAEKAGMETVYEERFDGSNQDFKTIVLKAKQANAGAYYVQTLPPALDILGKDIKDLELQNITGGAGTFTIGADMNLFEGYWYTEAVVSDESFKEKFNELYPETRFNIRTAPFGYDVLNIIVEGTESDDGLHSYLKNLGKYDGVVGNFSKDPQYNYLKAVPGIWKIVNGEPVLVKE